MVYIADVAERRVLQVERANGTLSVVAGQGSGPGEVNSPSALTILDDSLLIVRDRRTLLRYRLADRTYVGQTPIGFLSTSLAGWRGSTVLGSLQADSGWAFAILGDAGNPESVRHAGTVPELLRSRPEVAQAFGTIEVTRDDSTVVGMFEVSNTLYRWHLDSPSVDSVVLTATTRRGARPDHIQTLLVDPTKLELLFAWSVPSRVAMLSGNRSAVVFTDPTLRGQNYEGPSFVQVVDWTHQRSCADIALPVPTDVVPRYAFLGDTLIAVVQHADGAEGASTWIKRWRITPGGC